jgi:DNA-directed RNA polymerase specialized sigma24 family protein
MIGDREDDPTLAIQSVDKFGRPVSEELLAAAHQSWKRLVLYAERQGQDGSVVADVLEDTVHRLSSLERRHPQFINRIENLEHYVFKATAGRLNRRAAKEAILEYVGTLNDLDSLAGVWDVSWVSRVESELLLKEIVGYMNGRTRLLFNLRTLGFSWKDIAETLGTTANNVQSQFSQGVARVRKRVLGKEDSTAAPKPRRAQ